MVTLEAVLLLQLQPSTDTRVSLVNLVGQSNPTISVLLPTCTFFSFFPIETVRVLDSSSKLTTLPFMALEGQPAKTEPAKRRDTTDVIINFIVFVIRVCNRIYQSIVNLTFHKFKRWKIVKNLWQIPFNLKNFETLTSNCGFSPLFLGSEGSPHSWYSRFRKFLHRW